MIPDKMVKDFLKVIESLVRTANTNKHSPSWQHEQALYQQRKEEFFARWFTEGGDD